MKIYDIVRVIKTGIKGMLIDVESCDYEFPYIVEFWDYDKTNGEKYFWTECFEEEELELVY